MRKLFPILIALAFALAYGCSSGGSGSLGAGDGGAGGGGDDGGGGDTDTVQLGNGTGAAFLPGQIGVAVPTLAAGGSTTLSVTIVDENGSLVTGDPIDVSFSSVCSAQGQATIVSPVTTTTGIANSSYSATGCSGDDVITASATVGEASLTATGMVTVAPAAVGSIEFVSATPTNIGLKGTGGSGRSETSVVIFRVVDSSGGPVSGEEVSFNLNTTVGGIVISPTTATTGADGQAQTVVQAGTVATSVRVTAQVQTQAGTIATQSDQLTITTGVPDQDSTSLSIETLNPEAWNIDGVAVPVTVRLSDRFNNPVPDGTAVTFQTEGAQIGGQCTTVTTGEPPVSSCTVNWVSQNPRPVDGRSSILVSAIGEESFSDSNGDGVFNDGDSFVDIGEPFRDDNEDGIRDPLEPFVDFDVDGDYDPADPVDGLFNGLLCAHTTDCDPNATSVAVFDAGVIVMSEGIPDTTSMTGTFAAPASVGFEFADARGNPLPAGTTIDFETNNGEIVGPSSFTYPNTTEPQSFSVFIGADDTPSSGQLVITVESPGGLVTTAFVTITD